MMMEDISTVMNNTFASVSPLKSAVFIFFFLHIFPAYISQYTMSETCAAMNWILIYLFLILQRLSIFTTIHLFSGFLECDTLKMNLLVLGYQSVVLVYFLIISLCIKTWLKNTTLQDSL